MCGIFGCVSINGEKLDKDSIIKATHCLSHRGPDDFGIQKLDNVLIGHRRLQIIDLKTNAAKQPVTDLNSILAYNGMIYNFKELKKILSNSTNFIGNSDTEVLAKSLNVWGLKKTLKHIDGMFAFAWYCKKKREIYLVRDPIGEKPLYWAKRANKIYFSSEMKAFFTIKEFSKKPNIGFIDEFFYTHKISGSKTFYSQINEVEPGCIVKISTVTGSISFSSYFSLESTFNRERLNKNKIEELNYLMEESVSSRCLSDVPIGTLISGGLDSSIILSNIMKNENINKINCYFSDIKNQNFSELKDAILLLNFLNKKYKNKKIYFKSKKNNFSSYIDFLIKSTRSFDEPVHFGNTPDLLNVVNQASNDGIKVLLSGEGSDELFFGYNRMVRAYQFLNKNKSKKSIIEELYFGGGKHSIKYIQNLCGPDKQGVSKSSSWIWLEKNINKYSTNDLITMFSQKYRMQSLLQRQDRIGMLCGLEIRVPFLSKSIVNFANSLSFKDKFCGKSKNTKLILKLMTKQKKLIPSKIISKKKIGFNSDISDWLREDKLRRLLNNMIKDNNGFFNGYLNGKYAKKIINMHFEKKERLDVLIWSMLSLEIWHRACGEGDIDFFKSIE